MFICGFVVAVMLCNDSYYFFDSHSRNQHDKMFINGHSVLLKFSQLRELGKYIQTIYLLQRSQRHVYFQIQYIDVTAGGDPNEILRYSHHSHQKFNQQMKRRRDTVSQKKQQSDLSLSMTMSKFYSVLKSFQGSYNKGHKRCGPTAGIQCTCVSIFSLCWSVLRKVSIWQSHDLDNMVCTGDKICQDLGVSKYLNVDDFPVKIYLYGQSVIS